MVRVCVAANCGNSSKPAAGIHLYCFPRDERLNRQWTVQVQRTRANWKGPTSNSRLCSQHFSDDCFDKTWEVRKSLGFGHKNLRNLLPDAVPSIFRRKSDGPIKPIPRTSLAMEKRQRKQIVDELLRLASAPTTNTVKDTKSLQSDEGTTSRQHELVLITSTGEIKSEQSNCDVAFNSDFGEHKETNSSHESVVSKDSLRKASEKQCNINLRKYRKKIKKYFICDDCGKGFDNKMNLASHIRKHTKEKSCICTMCGKSLYEKQVLSIHAKIDGNREGNFACEISQSELTSNYDFALYRRMLDEEESLTCKECEKKYVRKTELLLHEKLCTCMECGKKLRCNGYLLNHMKAQHGKKNRYSDTPREIYACAICEKIYSSVRGLRDHMKTYHPLKNYVCKVCQKKYLEDCDLIEHDRIKEIMSLEMQTDSVVQEAEDVSVLDPLALEGTNSEFETQDPCSRKSVVTIIHKVETFPFVELGLCGDEHKGIMNVNTGTAIKLENKDCFSSGHIICNEEGESKSFIKEEMDESDIKVDPHLIDKQFFNYI